jgi:hypothetical protein
MPNPNEPTMFIDQDGELKSVDGTDNPIDRYLTSDDSSKRAYGRLLGTTVITGFQEWLTSEISRGTSPADTTLVIEHLATDLIANIYGYAAKDGANPGEYAQVVGDNIRQQLQTKLSGIKELARRVGLK